MIPNNYRRIINVFLPDMFIFSELEDIWFEGDIKDFTWYIFEWGILILCWLHEAYIPIWQNMHWTYLSNHWRLFHVFYMTYNYCYCLWYSPNENTFSSVGLIYIPPYSHKFHWKLFIQNSINLTPSHTWWVNSTTSCFTPLKFWCYDCTPLWMGDWKWGFIFLLICIAHKSSIASSPELFKVCLNLTSQYHI